MDKIYLYPQNSCEMKVKCTKDSLQCGAAFPDNCNSNLIEYSYAPHNLPPSGDINAINPSVLNDNYAKNFGVTNCKIPGCSDNPNYFSWDPRLYDSARAQYLLLDKPPISHSVKLADIYNDNLKDYGRIPGGYNSIKDGQITYYAGKERAEAPFRPIFNSNFGMSVETLMYRDPMGSVTPQYALGIPKWQNKETLPFNKAYPETCRSMGLSEIEDKNWTIDSFLSGFEATLQQKTYTHR